MFSNAFANQIAALLFHGTPIPALADNAATSPATQLYVSLHKADPGAGGTQTTTEADYTGYARIPVARTAAGWTIVGNVVSPTDTVEFPEMTGGDEQTITHIAVGTALTGAGTVLFRGAILPTIECKNGVVPRLRETTTITMVTAGA